VLWQTGRADQAAALFKEALARRPQYADAHYMLGTISRQRGDLDEALAEFRETIRMNPASAEAQTSLAQALQARHDPAGASAAFVEAERLKQSEGGRAGGGFRRQRGLERLKRNDLTAAIARFREAVRLDADNAQAHFQLALALRRSGALGSPVKSCQVARRLAPHLKPPDSEP